MSLLSMFLRISCKKNDGKRDAGLVYPKEIIREENISYGPDKMNLLDVYRPANVYGNFPVIVSVHGGGWVYGDKKLYSHYCVSLAKQGFVVVNFTYRLSPEHKFPCHLEDTVKVFDWIHGNGTNYGMDMNNIFAVGDSAGGHILAQFCQLCVNPEFAKHFDFSAPEDYVPKAIALNCAVLDMEEIKKGEGKGVAMLMGDILPRKNRGEWLKLISPIDYVNEKFPPCYLMTANEDFLRTQPDSFKKKLEEYKVSYEYKLYGDETHKLGHVFHLDMRNEIGQECNDVQCAFFRKYMSENITAK